MNTQKTTELNFSEALNLLKVGDKVCRKGWNGKGMYLILEKLFTHTPIRDNMVMQPFISMKTVDNTFVPWLASQTDLLANDWEIKEDDKKDN